MRESPAARYVFQALLCMGLGIAAIFWHWKYLPAVVLTLGLGGFIDLTIDVEWRSRSQSRGLVSRIVRAVWSVLCLAIGIAVLFRDSGPSWVTWLLGIWLIAYGLVEPDEVWFDETLPRFVLLNVARVGSVGAVVWIAIDYRRGDPSDGTIAAVFGIVLCLYMLLLVARRKEIQDIERIFGDA